MINKKADIPSKKVDVPLEEAHLIEYKSYLLHAISVLRGSSQKSGAHPLENPGQNPPDESSSANLPPNIEMILLRQEKTPECAITILQELSSAIEAKIIEMIEEEEKEEISQLLIL